MKMYRLLVIFLMCFATQAKVSAQCPDTLYVVEYGSNYIYGSFPDENLNLVFQSFDPQIFTWAVSFPTNTYKDIYRRFNFSFVDEIGTSGVYTLTSNSDSIDCTGHFIVYEPSEYLTTDIDCEGFDPGVGGFWGSCFEESVGFADIAYKVCSGDTTRFYIANESEVIEGDYPPLSIDRISIPNAEIIEIMDNYVDVVWTPTNLEGFCIDLKSIHQYGEQYQTSRMVFMQSKSDIILQNLAGETTSETCVGQPLALQARAEDPTRTIWTVSDGRVFYGSYNEIEFDMPGTYTITAESQGASSCNCISAGSHTVVVLAGESPEIECKQTVCRNDTTTYYSSHECDQYLWGIGTDGTIVAGGQENDSYVSVLWQGTNDTDVSLTTPNCFATTCLETTVEHIAVIDGSLTIEGPTEACQGNVTTYTVPNFTGTTFEWTLSGGGRIRSGHGTNAIQVEWFSNSDEPVLHNVRVSYENCSIDCDGFAVLYILVKPKLNLTGSATRLCRDQEADFAVTPESIAADWKLTQPDGSEVNLPTGNSATISSLPPGNYSIAAVAPANTTCNDSATFSFVVEPPIPTPSNIEGSRIICLGSAARYEIPNLKSTETVVWGVKDGTANFVNAGSSRELIVLWESIGPYEVSAYITDQFTGCESEVATFYIDSPADISGPAMACVGDESRYLLPDYGGATSINWTVLPENAGTILEQKDDYVLISWNNEGNHAIEAEYCGSSFVFSADIGGLPTFEVSYPNEVCKSDLALVTTTTAAENTVVVYDENGSFVTVGKSVNISAGEYTIEVRTPNGCITSEEIVIEELPFFEVEIDINRSLNACPGLDPFTVFVLNPSDDYTYQWFRDGIPVGVNSAEHMDTLIADYHVVVTDSYGCTDKSNTLRMRVCCSSSGSPVPTGVNLAMQDIDCNTKVFSVVPPFNSTTFNWAFDDPQGSGDRIGFEVQHRFSRAGRFVIVAYGDADCEEVSGTFCDEPVTSTVCEGGSMVVIIPVVANFEAASACNGEEMRFYDRSTKLNTVTGLEYSWDFGDPASGSSNTSTEISPSHIFSGAGTYQVTQTITYPAGNCTSTQTYSVEIADLHTVEVDAISRVCIGEIVEFDAVTNVDVDWHSWDFGDPDTGVNNVSNGSSAQHKFSKAGVFEVSLLTENASGCLNSATHVIEVIDPDFSGSILSSVQFPKCPGVVASLQAPSMANYSYEWNNEANSSNISVVESGKYSVTVTDQNGCSYVPAPISVYDYEIGDVQLYSYSYESKSYSYDTLTVCLGDRFDLICTAMPNAVYEWLNLSETNNKLNYQEYFMSLTPGTYTYNMVVTDTFANCTVEEGPFVVQILPEIEPPIITSSVDLPCENQPILLSVENPDPNYSYTWNTGETGESITVFSSGSYYVTATNEAGCGEPSKYFAVSPAPPVNIWMTGCMETCFPEYICLEMSPNYQYFLYKDGELNRTLSSFSSGVSLLDPGDYNLVVRNSSGCETTSDYLSVAAAPYSHTLEGVVFLDNDEDGVFGTDDDLQAGVIVFLMNGNTVVSSTITDASGNYSFDPVPQANLRVALDRNSFSFQFEGAADSILVFGDCNEAKLVNFPLISNCHNPVRVDTFYTCPEIPVLIDGKEYFPDQSDTVAIQLFEKCDSMYIRQVLLLDEPVIDLVTSNTCAGMQTGSIEILDDGGYDLIFSLSKTFEESDTFFGGLPMGVDTIFAKTAAGCVYSVPIEIEQTIAPETFVDIEKTCEGMTNGVLHISVLGGEELLFVLDQDSVVASQKRYENLAAGSYSILFQDSLGCRYSDEFEVEAYESPLVVAQTQSACEGISGGQITLEIQTGNPVFMLQGESIFSTNSQWSNLDTGSYVIYQESQFGCVDSLELILEEVAAPELEVDVAHDCENLQMGAISILGDTADVLFSLDGIDFSQDFTFENITAGQYVLYTQAQGECVFEQPFEVSDFEEPELSLLTQASCQQINTGELSIQNANGQNWQFSLDSNVFNSQTEYEELPAGDHRLFVAVDTSGCVYSYPFSIETAPVPEVELSTEGACPEEEGGSIGIEVLQGEGLQFKLEGSSFWINTTGFGSLTAGTYGVLFQDTLGCLYREEVVVEELPAMEFLATSFPSCEEGMGGTIQLTTENDSALFIVRATSFSTETYYPNLASGTYMIVAENTDGCIDVQHVDIAEIPKPEISIAKTVACEGGLGATVLLQSTTDGVEYSFNGIDFDAQKTFSNVDSGRYTIHYRTVEGCEWQDSFDVELAPVPDLALTTKSSCEDQLEGEVIIEGNSADLAFSLDGISYGNDSVFSALTAGEYQVIALDTNGCQFEFETEIKALPLPEFLTDIQGSCSDSASGQILLSVLADSLLFAIDGSSFESVQKYPALLPGVYEVRAKNQFGCEAEKLVEVPAFAPLEASMEEVASDCMTEQILISPIVHSHHGPVRFRWHDGSTNSTITARQTGKYTVDISDACTTENLEVDLEFAILDEENLVQVPNIFSPKTQPPNDCFLPTLTAEMELIDYQLQIFDRWGNKAFESTDEQLCWQGDHLNKPAEEGVYVYVINMTVRNCEEVRSIQKVGDITLVW